ncbi:serrate RNA effector molecule homolog [Mercenaria mercenaria]|uniref:serrate RNA effector molecule homolog n=1 Tax=Mercenaria mercenaria TaxID=6596 RepID=UPI00234EFA52|nr:serrate RNA effector molecule homolog [Mercenaria mercenaria]
MADNENEVNIAETQKTDDDKTEAGTDGMLDTDKDGEETAKESKYDSDEFETESESSVPKTDEEKYAEKSKADSPDNEDVEVKTDDEKLANDSKEEQQTESEAVGTKEENGESVPVNTETETNTEMSETVETKTDERSEDTQPVSQQDEQKQEQDGVTAQGDANADAEPSNQETETEQEKATSEKEPENEVEETPTNEDKAESGHADVVKEDHEEVPVAAGSPIEKEKLDSKIRENEELSQQLESSLSNQEADKAAYKKLTEENARLQKHYDDMKEKFDDMEGGHVVLVAEVETLRKVNQEQREAIVKLESDIKLLKETQGGDENVKDMQEKLIRMSNEQEEKDRRIHSLEGELDATREKLKDAESRAARGGNNTAQNSKTCIVM